MHDYAKDFSKDFSKDFGLNEDENSSDAALKNATLFVSLYLMLLAFFLLLISISNPKDKNKDAIIGSVQSSFSPKKSISNEDEKDFFNPYQPEGDKIILQKELSEIIQITRETLSMTKAKIKEFDDYAIITIAKNLFFTDDTADILPEQLHFIQKISTRLVELQQKKNIELEITVTTDNLKPNNIAILQANNIANEFTKDGSNPDFLSTGLTQNTGNNIQFKFTILQEAE